MPKIGPLDAKGWLVVGAIGVGGYIVYRRRMAAVAAASSNQPLPNDTMPIGSGTINWPVQSGQYGQAPQSITQGPGFGVENPPGAPQVDPWGLFTPPPAGAPPGGVLPPGSVGVGGTSLHRAFPGPIDQRGTVVSSLYNPLPPGSTGPVSTWRQGIKPPGWTPPAEPGRTGGLAPVTGLPTWIGGVPSGLDAASSGVHPALPNPNQFSPPYQGGAGRTGGFAPVTFPIGSGG